MAYPTVTQTWTISANNRYVFSSVLLAMSNVVLSLKNFLKTTMGYTVKGSSNGTTGAMDGVDRWTLATDAQTRQNSASLAISWVVLTDGNGIDICLAFNTTANDWYRLSYSPGGNYVAAGTATFQPTAIDEAYDSNATNTWIHSTATTDRLWHLWGSFDKKMWRITIYANGGAIQSLIGVERFSSALVSPATMSLAIGGGTAAVYKFYYPASAVGYTLSANIPGAFSATISEAFIKVHTTADAVAGIGGSIELLYSGRPDGTSFTTTKTELQGENGLLMIPIGLASGISATCQGKVGQRIDWWAALADSNASPVTGELLGSAQFFIAGPFAVLPWDGTTVPLLN